MRLFESRHDRLNRVEGEKLAANDRSMRVIGGCWAFSGSEGSRRGDDNREHWRHAGPDGWAFTYDDATGFSPWMAVHDAEGREVAAGYLLDPDDARFVEPFADHW